MNKNPIRSAVLWFLGVTFLTGSGMLGMIAAFIAYNSTRNEILRSGQNQDRSAQYTTRRREVNPWTGETYQDVSYNTQSYEEPHVSLRPDEKFVEFETAAPAQPAADEAEPESGFAAEGKRYIASLRLAKASIDNKVIQDKITEVEKIVENIYARVEEKPEQTAEVRDFMDKTMPLTTSVLDSYAEMNLRKIQGKDFTRMEGDVIDLLDKTRQAYTKLYDKMYDGDILDVTTDISVLKTLLSQEGLLGGDFDTTSTKEGETRQMTQ